MKRVVAILASVTVTAAIARAQPVPDVPIPPDTGSGSDSVANTGNAPVGSGSATAPIPPDNKDKPIGPADPYPVPPPPKKAKLRAPLSPWCPWRNKTDQCMPEVLTTPTGWLLPGAMLYSKTGLDTGGGVSSDHRIGLGDVAEFGVLTTDAVRDKDNKDARASRIQPYVLASFRLGVPESRLFAAQPGMTLGFRKSFERNHDNFKTRVAELTLVASKHLHKNFAVHLGGAFWDASLNGKFDGAEERTEFTLHGRNDPFKKQVRVFGGIEVRPLENSQILVDVGWAPEFCYQCTNAQKITLKPVLSWGVRNQLATWVRFEAGVRLPDIGEANLLDAQIFGQLTLTSGALRSAVESFQ